MADRWVAAVAAGASLTLAGCASLPEGPPDLPPTFIPEVTPSASPSGIPVGDDGFTIPERFALRVTAETCEGWGNGSAWVLDENTAVTNRHVIEGAYEIELTSYDGHHYTGTSSVMSDFADLALIEIDGTFPEVATLAPAEPERNSELTIVGYPEGGQLTSVSGPLRQTVPETLEENQDDVWTVIAVTKPGNSGSPVVNEVGEVVGVLYASDGGRVSYVVTHESITRFIDDPSEHVSNDVTCDWQ